MRRRLIALTVALVLAVAVPAWADINSGSSPSYVYTGQASTTIVQSPPMYANAIANDGTVFTDTHVSWSIQAGDQLGIQWFSSSGSQLTSTHLDTSSTTASNVDVTPPAGAYVAKLVLMSGSATGNRYLWWDDVTNSSGITATFPAPTITQPPPSNEGTTPTSGSTSTPPSTTTNVNVDMSGVIDAINALGGQLDTIISNQGTMIGQLNDLKGKMDSVIGQLTTLNGTVSDIDSYLTTPRQSQPLDTSSLGAAPTFNPTPPPITEPPAQPYTYDRQPPQMPPYVDSPGPLPINPEPVAMAHDPPATVDPPAKLDAPLTPDQPLTVTPPHVDAPLTPDPVHMDTPLTPAPVHMDTPLTPQAPAQAQQPVTLQSPLSPQSPVTPQPPLTPQ